MAITYVSPNCGEVQMLMYEKEPDYILSLVPDDGLLVEWGCGGSTIYFLDNLKPNQYLVSIEHVEDWFNEISEKIKDHPNAERHIFLLIPPEGVRNNHYAVPEEEMGCGLHEYIAPDSGIISGGDVFLVDGIGRGPTAAYLSRRIKSGAHVIIHDYTGRENWYDWAVNCFDYNVKPDEMVLVHMRNEPIGE